MKSKVLEHIKKEWGWVPFEERMKGVSYDDPYSTVIFLIDQIDDLSRENDRLRAIVEAKPRSD